MQKNGPEAPEEIPEELNRLVQEYTETNFKLSTYNQNDI